MGGRFARSERASVVPEGTALPSVMTALLEKRRANEAIFWPRSADGQTGRKLDASRANILMGNQGDDDQGASMRVEATGRSRRRQRRREIFGSLTWKGHLRLGSVTGQGHERAS